MNNLNFPSQVKQHFGFLFEKHGFSYESEQYTDFPFSEWIIIMCSKEFCIQVSIDKSQVFIDFGLSSEGKFWFDLMHVLMFASGNTEWRYHWPKGTINELYYDQQLAYLSKTIREHFEEIRATAIRILKNTGERKRFERFIAKYSK